jgi:GAF domain-containing protein
VVPVFDRNRNLIAVLDIDSEETGSFGEEDREGLEKVMSWFERNAA